MLRPILWQWDDSAGMYIDRTFQSGWSALEDANDVLYIGFDRRFDALYFNLTTGGSYTGPSDMQLRPWNGEEWEIRGILYNLSESKFVKWNLRADCPEWTRLAFTPTSPHTATPPDSKDRYWMKLHVGSVTTAAVVSSIEISPYAHYATSKSISDFLQYSGFDLTTLPSESVVEDLIRRHESALEKITRRSWRLNEATDVREFNYAGIKLIHAPIRSLERVRIWQGTSWRTLQQGRTGECYAVDDLGLVYFTRFFVPVFVPYSGGGAVMPFVYLYMLRYPVEIKYLHGADFESDGDAGLVEHTVTLMTAVSLMEQYERSILTKAGVDRIEMSTRVRGWKEDIEKDLATLARGITVW